MDAIDKAWEEYKRSRGLTFSSMENVKFHFEVGFRMGADHGMHLALDRIEKLRKEELL